METTSHENFSTIEQSKTNLFDNTGVDKLLFSIDVKDVVNKTDLKLPEKGKLLLACLRCFSSDLNVVLMVKNQLNLCRVKDIKHIDYTCAWKIIMVEQHL